MIKECQVLLQNEAVIVVRYDDIDIQLPYHEGDFRTVFVKYEDGRYTIVDDSTESIVIEKKKIKKTTKVNVKDRKEDESTNA